jgi:catechol 2,3-dioxygenase-like lactoylglutathione lyase family enzyme
MSWQEFEDLFARLKAAGIPYGGSFDSVGSMSGPGEETGARGMGKAVYFFDPDRHLIEIRHYDRA